MISAFFAAGNDDQTESEDAIWAKLTSQVNAMSRSEGRITHSSSIFVYRLHARQKLLGKIFTKGILKKCSVAIRT